jgi:hypothetical protein
LFKVPQPGGGKARSGASRAPKRPSQAPAAWTRGPHRLTILPAGSKELGVFVLSLPQHPQKLGAPTEVGEVPGSDRAPAVPHGQQGAAAVHEEGARSWGAA